MFAPGNVYEDAQRAAGYAALEFPGTYYLAYRDLSELIAAHVVGRRALDFGCGTGRSTRFLRRMGFEAIGVDVAEVEDVLFTDASYREVYRRAGLDVLAVHGPLGRPDEPIAWVTETQVAPWAIHVLGGSERA